VAEQVDVCAVVIEAGEQLTLTEVMLDAAATLTVAEPDLVASSVLVAVMVAAPAPAGVKIPALLTVPMLDGLMDQVTPLL
jgi:hypothetical protein